MMRYIFSSGNHIIFNTNQFAYGQTVQSIISSIGIHSNWFKYSQDILVVPNFCNAE